MNHSIPITVPAPQAAVLKAAREEIASALDAWTSSAGDLAELEATEAALSAEASSPEGIDHADRAAVAKHEEQLSALRIVHTKIAARRDALGPQSARIEKLIAEHEATLREAIWPAVEAERQRLAGILARFYRDEMASLSAAGRTHYLQSLTWLAQCNNLRADAKEVCARRFIAAADAALAGAVEFEFESHNELSAKPPAA